MLPNVSRLSRGRWLPGAAALVVLAVLATACGSGGTKAAASTTTTTVAGRGGAALKAFTDCMKSHGVTVPAQGFRGGTGAGGTGGTRGTAPSGSVPPTTLPPGVTQQQYDAAIAACRSLIPARQASPAAAAYRNCINLQLQQHGATTLPPAGQGGGGGGFGGGGGGFGGPGGSTATADPALQAAMQACAALRPAPRATTTTQPPTTS